MISQRRPQKGQVRVAHESWFDAHEDKNTPSFFVDAHVDLPYFMMNHVDKPTFSSLNDGPFTFEKARQSGIRLFCSSLYCEDRFNGEASFRHLQDVLNFTLQSFDQVTIVKEEQDLDQLSKKADHLGTILLLENADALAGNLYYIEQLMQTGIRTIGLTHAGKNRLGDGNAVLFSDGFSAEGIEVIRTVNEYGLIIDVAHLHEKCFWQLLDLIEAPIVTTHTGIRNVCDIPRNIDLEQAKKISERNGIVGVSFNPEMLSPKCEADVEQVFVHLDALVQKLGPDTVGIGSDYCGFEYFAEGLEDITGIRNLMEVMLMHGYGNTAIQKIMGLNWLRFYKSLY